MDHPDFKKVVERLVMQFHEYDNWTKIIAQLESELLQQATHLAHASEKPLSAIITASDMYPDLQTINSELALARLDQQRVSDEMSYQNHIVWMMYKHTAYKGTPSEIPTVGSFQRHCSPKDYICTKRYMFLKDWLEGKGVNIEDESIYPKDMPLDKYCNQPVFAELLTDVMFLEQWKYYEYFVRDGQISKWKNFPVG
jgi:hypothetical protein